MLSKRKVVAAFAVLNVVLLVLLVMSSYSLPTAYAQRMGGASNFVAVTSQADTDYDVLFVADLGERKLHCFAPDRNRTGEVEYIRFRDLAQDFKR